jgi:hypothetical protein
MKYLHTIVCIVLLGLWGSVAFGQSGLSASDTAWLKNDGFLIEPPAVSVPSEEQHLTHPRMRFLTPSPITPPSTEGLSAPVHIPFFTPATITTPSSGVLPASQGYEFYQGANITPPDYHNPYNPTGISLMAFAPSNPILASARTVYRDYPTTGFTGGLNLVDWPNEIGDNEALELENFVWTPAGGLEPRPGFKFRKDQTTEFDAGKKIYGLHAYYKDGNNFTLAGVDAKVWADTNQTGSWISVKTGLQSNASYYDFVTFKGKAIVAHSGDYPFWYDGSTTGPIGIADSGRGTLIRSGGIGDADCKSYILTGESKFTFPMSPTTGVVLPPRPQDRARWRRTETPVTVYDRSNVLVYEPDRWAGYVLRFVDTLGVIRWHHIESNIEDTLYLRGQPAYTETHINGKYYIHSYFDYDKNLSESVEGNGIITGDLTTAACRDSLTVELHWFNCAPIADQLDSGLVLRVMQGISAGQEAFIVDANASCTVVVAAAFDSVQNGDSIWVYKKRFWKPSLVEIFKNRIFFAGIENYENLVVFSSYNKLGDFPPDNHFVVKTQDGDKITGLATFYDDQLGYKDQSRDCLVIFKENSTWKLVWNSEMDYHLVLVSPTVGCVAPKSIVSVEGRYLLFIHTTGVYAFDGRGVNKVSPLIQPIIDGIGDEIDQAAGGYYKDHYYLSYAESGNSINNKTVVFHTKFGGWGNASKPVAGLFASQVGITDSCKLIFSHPTTKTLTFEFDMAETDTGVAIPLTYKSKAFEFNSLTERKRFTYFDINYLLPSGDFSVDFYTDFGDSLRYNTTVDEAGGYRYKHLLLDEDCIGRNFSYKITSSSDLRFGKTAIKFKNIKE